MTAWWNSTTRVRKVRVRSIEAFRTLAFGAALVSADATEVEIVVMCAPGRWSVSDVAAGNPIQQAIIARQDAPILILAHPASAGKVGQWLRSVNGRRAKTRPPYP